MGKCMNKINLMNSFRFLFVIILIFTNLTVLFSQAVVSGIISDADDSPVFLANISIKGTPSGTMTGNDGYYEILIPANTEVTLVFSYVGFLSQEKKNHSFGPGKGCC